WKQYAGLDDKTLELLGQVTVEPLSEAQLEFQTVTIMFLPHELEQARASFDAAKDLVKTDELWAAGLDQYDRFVDGLEESGAAYNVRNVATQLLVMLGVYERHRTDLQAGW